MKEPDLEVPNLEVPNLEVPDLDIPDHRRLGRQLKIFATDEACGAGLPLWLPAGAAVRAEIERFIVDLERLYGYQHVYTPEMAKRQLYERSGHWAHYHDDMYPPMDVGPEQVVLRPMNCPHHILVYGSEPRTLRDMPFRLAELGRFTTVPFPSGWRRLRWSSCPSPRLRSPTAGRYSRRSSEPGFAPRWTIATLLLAPESATPSNGAPLTSGLSGSKKGTRVASRSACARQTDCRP